MPPRCDNTYIAASGELFICRLTLTWDGRHVDALDGVDMRHHFVFLAGLEFDAPIAGRTRRLAECLRGLDQIVTFVSTPSVRRVLAWSRETDTACGINLLRLAPMPWCLRGGWWERRWLARSAARLAERLAIGAPAVVIASTPWWAKLVGQLAESMGPLQPLICYDWIDDLAVHAGPKETGLPTLRVWEKQLRQASDLIFTVSPALYRQATHNQPADRVVLIPNAVNRSWLDSPPDPVAPADDRVDFSKPIAGFLGALYEWIDIELVVRVARQLPHMQFVLVGPGRREVSLSALNALPNVVRVGAVAHSQVPRWLAAFDVCLIPFFRNPVTAAADPIKVYEYCAMGKPVVSTVEHRAGGRTAPISVAKSASEFAAAILQAVSSDSAQERRQRVQYAQANTWEDRAAQLLQCVQEMGGRRVAA